MAPRHRGRPWLPWVGLAASLFVIAVAVVLVLATGREGDTSNPDVEFNGTATQPSTQTPAEQPPKRGHPADDGFSWPFFGLDEARTRVLGLKAPFRPPFRRAWQYNAHALIEFPPSLCRRSLFLLDDSGDLSKIGRWTGAPQWKLKLGNLAASTPACDGSKVYAVLLRNKTGSGGRVVAVGGDKGRLKWSHALPGRAESSPMVDRGRLFFGAEDGSVYALDTRTGRLIWRFRAAGAVKGSLALSNGKLYFGTYGGWVYAIRRSNGRQVWRTRAAGGGAFGLGSGNFYSTPAVEYGRVYLGATNGAVYSLSARTGKLAWRKQTGAYVYGSPAVGSVAGGPPTVWIGSYNGNLYALDARSGSVRWSRRLGGKISGSPTVIGDLVFVSAFDKRTSWAVGANTGRIFWRWPHGSFTLAISDGRRLYLNGYSTLYAKDPKGHRFASRRGPTQFPEAKKQRKKREAAKRKRAAAKKRKAAAKKRKSAAKKRKSRRRRRG